MVDSTEDLRRKPVGWKACLRVIMDNKDVPGAGEGFSGGSITKFSPFSGYKRTNDNIWIVFIYINKKMW